MPTMPDRDSFGTLLRHVLEMLDGDVATVEAGLGLSDYRPRYSPVVRALAASGPMSIRDVAAAVGVTHSAASQTVAQMVRSGLLTLEPGVDARQRIAHLTPEAQALLPTIQAAWGAAVTAMAELDAELSMPLADLLAEVVEALDRRPFRQRMIDAAQ